MSKAAVIATPVAAAVALALSIPSFAAPPQDPAAGRILVQTRAGLPPTQLDKLLRGHGARPMGRIGKLDVHLAQVPEQAKEKILAALNRNPHIEFAEPDQLVEPIGHVPNDPKYVNAWHLPVISAGEAWPSTMGEGQVIAILDTGVDASHPDLGAQLVPGYNAVDGSNNSGDVNGHGTKVAGSAADATDNGIGVASVAGRASIMPVRISNFSDGTAYYSDVARG
ncbi:MAG: S8 family serine peptidase, partial [Candidatus Competibacteraceae bacterium]|nr:S8 family serine peptidase [Candidatus Competibacteraceae bacterium]